VANAAPTRPTRSFPPSARLRLPREFATVLASRQRLRCGCFELRHSPSEGAGARLGLVLPKRLARRAVLRNLLKRLARESFRDASSGLPAVDVVLRLVRPPLLPPARTDRRQRAIWRRDIDKLLAGLRS
jgi:ribonuclease P protein component